ncbi:Retinal cone rhodopsin-sensitive cGMP 3',5'-cyclic phosphodiesterase subunit gamma [Cricetulus griseus]|uniref:Retinal cone rhodopsin-sensitive cGMP 3',5'-cyclic phosphodiesterase subunit gamma n=1 Tax=Cricetulus griseus TaxID=10029 RepID=G3H4P2_CRIGR|nr:Retinal cone rhodopsin-sensitive cGMP 3',5'-cyclic phosphodiesterase subunit gamma [Cricetulus griseus]
MSDGTSLGPPAASQGPITPRKGPPKFKQRQTRQFKSKPPKKGVKGFGDDIPGMEGLGTAFSHDLQELRKCYTPVPVIAIDLETRGTSLLSSYRLLQLWSIEHLATGFGIMRSLVPSILRKPVEWHSKAAFTTRFQLMIECLRTGGRTGP